MFKKVPEIRLSFGSSLLMQKYVSYMMLKMDCLILNESEIFFLSISSLFLDENKSATNL